MGRAYPLLMRLTRFPCLLIIFTLLFTLPGCKRKQASSAGSRLSPAAQPIAGGMGQDEEQEEDDEELRRRLEDQENLRALGPAPGDEPDSGAPVARASTGTADQEEADKAAKEAEIKAHQDRADTEKAVNSALNGILPKLRGCYQSGGGTAAASTVSLRVHRMGYIINSNVSGASARTNACIQEILGNVRVQGVKTDTITVKRQFSFK
jgi:hypothetical protein